MAATIKREQSFENYIKTIIDDINSDVAIPLSYPETWKKETNELYKDLKHAGRGHTQPEGEQLLKHLNEGDTPHARMDSQASGLRYGQTHRLPAL